MKATKPILYTALVAMTALFACQKSELLSYTNEPGVYFYQGPNITSIDSVGYNFILLPINEAVDTVYLPLRIMGDPASTDREVAIQVVDSSTAKEGVHFTFGAKIVHAGKFTDSIPLYLKRTSEMTTSILKLFLQIVPSKDFQPGYATYQDFKITITDQLIPPTWSFTMSSTFGTYSTVKFRFMVSVLQRVSFTGLFPSELASMASQVKLALAEYENTNGPLLDENGIRVVFP